MFLKIYMRGWTGGTTIEGAGAWVHVPCKRNSSDISTKFENLQAFYHGLNMCICL